MSDLLVYGPDPELPVDAWLDATRRAGVDIALPGRFSAATHAGYIALQIRLLPNAPLSRSDRPVVGVLAGGFELFFEFFQRPDALPAGPLTRQQRIEGSGFVAMFQLSADDGPVSCVAAFCAAVGLAEACGGLVLDEERGHVFSQ